MAFFTYILASQRNGTLHIGSTEDLVGRASQHQQKLQPGFTSKYGVDRLVWYESHDTREVAFTRGRFDPGWRDLFSDLL